MPTIGPGIPGSVMEAFAEGFTCGIAGTLTVTIDDSNGANVLGPTTANIIELECTPDNFGVYRYLGTFLADPALSPYLITWEGASGTDPGIITTASEEILVSTDAPAPPSGAGPCSDWITEEDVVACCNVETSSGVIFDDVIGPAQSILYELSGQLYPGLCGPVTVRPCGDWGACFPFQNIAYAGGGSRWLWTGAFWGYWDGFGWGGERHCGCSPLSRVKLSGFPVQGINQVKIDGDVVAPSDYRLDENRYLTRMNGEFWPACQNLSLEDDEEGTFSVSYWFGEQPPALGVSAAAQLACELYKECVTGTCALPKGTTRVIRQGITIEKLAFTNWGFTSPRYARGGRASGWNTGLPLVDAFLNTYNRTGNLRRPVFWAPGRRYARPVG